MTFQHISIGAVLLATLGGAQAATVLPGKPAAGKAVFAKCASCHRFGHSGSVFGPPLTAVVGRQAGTVAGYRYSDAMKAARLVWSEANLAAFLRAPDKVVPDTKMRFYGLSDEQQIADLLAYLRTTP